MYPSWFTIVLISILFVIVIVWLVHERTQQEFFIQQDLAVVYSNWRTLYMALIDKWNTAIVTAVGLERPAPTDTAAQPPPPTLEEKNTYIRLLGQKLGTTLPLFPSSEPPTNMDETTDLSAWESWMDHTVWIAAIQWTNRQLEQSFANMEKALKGEGFLDVEGYSDASTCQGLGVVECVEQHPEILDKWMAAKNAKEAEQRAARSAVWKKKMEDMLASNELRAAMQQNDQLAAKAKDVQNRASSGAILNDLNLPQASETPNAAATITPLPVKTLDPVSYQKYQRENPSLLSLKATLDSINTSLH